MEKEKKKVKKEMVEEEEEKRKKKIKRGRRGAEVTTRKQGGIGVSRVDVVKKPDETVYEEVTTT